MKTKAKTIVPRDYTRSLELIMQENPKMNAKELLAEQEYDKACFELWKTKINKDRLDFIKDINTNGGFYKGTFGFDQRYYYNITNARLEGNTVYAEVEKIVAFFGHKNGVIKLGDVNIEKRKKELERIENYGLETCERVTKEDYVKIDTYLQGLTQFWEPIKES